MAHTPTSGSGGGGRPPLVGVWLDKPARCEGVQVAHSEGLTNHPGRELCARVANGVREAIHTGFCEVVIAPQRANERAFPAPVLELCDPLSHQGPTEQNVRSPARRASRFLLSRLWPGYLPALCLILWALEPKIRRGSGGFSGSGSRALGSEVSYFNIDLSRPSFAYTKSCGMALRHGYKT